jgi:hypothetical protein
LPHCPFCRETLKRVRRSRERERLLLRDYLAHAEERLPSTTAHILSALREEEVRKQTDPLSSFRATASSQEPSLPSTSPLVSRALPSRRGVRSRALALIAVATLAVLSFGLISHLAWLHPSSKLPSQVSPSAPQASATTLSAPNLSFASDWATVIALTKRAGQSTLEVFDPLNARQSVLVSTGCADAQPDAIAHSGANVLYHCYDGKYTQFHLLTGQSYRLEGGARSDGGVYNAVWSTDDRYLFLAEPHALVRIDVASDTVGRLPYSLDVTRLLFYYDNGLYFTTRAGADQSTILKRLDLASGVQEEITRSSAPDPQFWLRPDGQMIYYTSTSTDGQVGLYAVSREGGNT